MSLVLEAADIVELTAVIQNREQIGMNVYHIHIVGTPTPTLTDLELAHAFSGFVADPYKAALASDSIFLGTIARILNRTPHPASQHYTADAGAGTNGDTTLPRQSSALISWRTDFSGPGKRGRSFIPFPPATADEGGGVPTAAYLTLLSDLAVAILGHTVFEVGAHSATGVWVLLKKEDMSVTSLTDYRLPKKFATQKRRGSYGKANSSPF